MNSEVMLRQEIVKLLPRLRRFARGLCHDAADADDIVQQAVEKALSRLHQFEAGTRLDSWLFRIVQTAFLDERRRANRREQHMETSKIEALPEAQASDATAQFAERSILQSALEELPEEQRVIVISVLVEGYAYREVSDMLNIPIGTVMSRLSRARKTLAARLRGTPDE